MGLLTGLVAGAVGAVLYSVQTGRDLRDEFEQVRSDIQRRDFEALGNRLEDRFKELQTSFDQRMAEAREASSQTTERAAKGVESAADAAADATGSSSRDKSKSS
jgi:gas vesicle protein